MGWDKDGGGNSSSPQFPLLPQKRPEGSHLPFLGKSARDKRLQVILTSATTSPYTSSGGPKLPRDGVRGGGGLRGSRGPCPTPPPRGGLGDCRRRASSRAEHGNPNPVGGPGPRPLGVRGLSPALSSLRPQTFSHPSRLPAPQHSAGGCTRSQELLHHRGAELIGPFERDAPKVKALPRSRSQERAGGTEAGLQPRCDFVPIFRKPSAPPTMALGPSGSDSQAALSNDSSQDPQGALDS